MEPHVRLDYWTVGSPPGWSMRWHGPRPDLRWEVENIPDPACAAIATLPAGGEHVFTTGEGRFRVTRIDGVTFTCTAWELLGDYNYLLDTTHEVMLPGGRTAYHSAAASQDHQKVRLSRLATNPLHQVNRYVPADQQVRLVPILDRR